MYIGLVVPIAAILAGTIVYSRCCRRAGASVAPGLAPAARHGRQRRRRRRNGAQVEQAPHVRYGLSSDAAKELLKWRSKPGQVESDQHLLGGREEEEAQEAEVPAGSPQGQGPERDARQANHEAITFL